MAEPEKQPGVSDALPKDGQNLGGAVMEGPEEFVAHPLKSMGEVFDGAKKIITGHNVYDGGKVADAFKILQPKQIGTELALPGLEPGVAQTHINGNVTTYLDKNVLLFIQGTRTEMTMQEADFGFMQNKNTAVYGNEEQLNYKRNDLFVLGEATLQYKSTREIHAPEDFEWKQFDRGFSATKLEFAALETSATLAKVEFTGLDYSLKGIDLGPEKDLLEMYKAGKWNFNKFSENAAEEAEAKEAAEKAAQKAAAEKAAAEQAAAAEKAAAEKAAAEKLAAEEAAGSEVATGEGLALAEGGTAVAAEGVGGFEAADLLILLLFL